MRTGRHNWDTETKTRAAFVCAALVFALLVLGLLLKPLFAPAAPTPAPTPSAAPAPEAAVVLLGDGSNPLCAPLYPALEELCAAKNWRLVTYDCKGSAASQKGQIEDVLRVETADAAVLFSVLDQEELDKQVQALGAKCAVVTVGRRAKRGAAAHVGGEEDEKLRAVAAWLKDGGKGGRSALLLTDEPDEAAQRRYARTLSKEKVTVLDNGYTWGGAFYAQRYLNSALETFPETDAVLCASPSGVQGAAAALEEKKLRDGVKIVALDYDPSLADALALGNLDAAAALSPQEAAEAVADLLPKVLKQEKIQENPLEYHILTPENVDELELGYE